MRLQRAASLRRTAAQHAERVYSVVQGAAPVPAVEELASSWQRSTNRHGVDPLDSRAPRILTVDELKDSREPLGNLISTAQEELDRLYKVVREAGYTILFCDTAGVAVEHRGEDTEASQFEYWGTWLGGVWAEESEGTNGIGTCIAEERPVTVHRSQHFRSRHLNLSCSGAPIFGVDGRLLAVLDVSAIDPGRSERAHALTGALTVNSARAIEERLFREHFRHDWVIAIAPPGEDASGMLLAVDGEQRVIGANRVARRALLLDDRGLQAGVSLWTVFKQDPEVFRRKDGADAATRLVIAGGRSRSSGERSQIGATRQTPHCTRARAWTRSALSRRWRQRQKHTADCRPRPCAGSGNMWMRIWGTAWIWQRWPALRESRSTISREDSSSPPA